MQVEFYNLVRKSGREPSSTYGVMLGVLMMSIVAMSEMALVNYHLIWVFMPLLSMVYVLEIYKRHAHPFTNIAYTIMGVVYVALPLSMLINLSFESGTYTYQRVVGLFFLVWSNDVGAYFAGILLGKTKLFESISPKKTWEGTIGGIIFCQFFAFLLFQIIGYQDAIHWHAMALIVGIAGTYGDLVESLFKRSVSTKDSGSKLPGHGGFLDRFDSLVFTVPFILVYFKLADYFVK